MEEKIYWIAKDEDSESLEGTVTDALKRGYKLQGGVQTDVDQGQVMFYQALYKPEPKLLDG